MRIGYIDLMHYDENGTLHIIDWKTSSKFDKEHLISAGRQLIFYALAKRAEGYIVSRVSWVMLKYCVTKWQLKNGKSKVKKIILKGVSKKNRAKAVKKVQKKVGKKIKVSAK
ncbi:PD-(D/E)XK nuclease family protein [Butyrivibrio sp. AE3004]|uniref:PD-(D/E)XK nuclease family protein n=1 Tax=Butyrivibrio sp. AE3004 TaxID=1506994 RepID=UPI0018CC6810|nr:PD-(D/E)XK nuclease family protein [Butyrivibrio sp. AE3004]